MDAESWKIQFAQYLNGRSSTTISLLELLESHVIPWAEYVEWAQQQFGLPVLKDEFFTKFTMSAEQREQLQTLGKNSFWMMDQILVGTWDGLPIIAGVSPCKSDKPHVFLLTNPANIKRWHQILANSDRKVNAPPPSREVSPSPQDIGEMATQVASPEALGEMKTQIYAEKPPEQKSVISDTEATVVGRAVIPTHTVMRKLDLGPKGSPDQKAKHTRHDSKEKPMKISEESSEDGFDAASLHTSVQAEEPASDSFFNDDGELVLSDLESPSTDGSTDSENSSSGEDSEGELHFPEGLSLEDFDEKSITILTSAKPKGSGSHKSESPSPKVHNSSLTISHNESDENSKISSTALLSASNNSLVDSEDGETPAALAALVSEEAPVISEQEKVASAAVSTPSEAAIGDKTIGQSTQIQREYSQKVPLVAPDTPDTEEDIESEDISEITQKVIVINTETITFSKPIAINSDTQNTSLTPPPPTKSVSEVTNSGKTPSQTTATPAATQTKAAPAASTKPAAMPTKMPPPLTLKIPPPTIKPPPFREPAAKTEAKVVESPKVPAKVVETAAATKIPPIVLKDNSDKFPLIQIFNNHPHLEEEVAIIMQELCLIYFTTTVIAIDDSINTAVSVLLLEQDKVNQDSNLVRLPNEKQIHYFLKEASPLNIVLRTLKSYHGAITPAFRPSETAKLLLQNYPKSTLTIVPLVIGKRMLGFVVGETHQYAIQDLLFFEKKSIDISLFIERKTEDYLAS